MNAATMHAHAVIAARGGEPAKSRCAPALNAAGRAELARAMLLDMIQALQACAQLRSIRVATPTPELAAAARAAGVLALLEPEPRGVNAAFEAARAAVRAADPQGVVVALPGDLPLIEATDVEAALARLSPGAVVLAPAAADGGTGAVILRADAPFAFRFGRDSFRRHAAEAAAAGLAVETVRAAGLATDIDRPEDLAAVLRGRPGGRTAQALRRAGVLEVQR